MEKKDLNNKDILRTYFDNCQFIYLLELLVIFSNREINFKLSSLFKVHNGIALLDDSFIIDKNNRRRSKGTIEEPFRGYDLFIRLDAESKIRIIENLYYSMNELKKILNIIIKNEYTNFIPEEWLFLLSNILLFNKNYHAIDLISNEISNKIYELSFEQKMNLFRNLKKNKELWNSKDFKPQARLRFLVMYIFYSRNIKLNY
jgi:hypothetical protein